MGFPWGKLMSEARLMRGTYLFSRVSTMSTVPLIRQPYGLPPSPKGKAITGDGQQNKICIKRPGRGEFHGPALFSFCLSYLEALRALTASVSMGATLYRSPTMP